MFMEVSRTPPKFIRTAFLGLLDAMKRILEKNTTGTAENQDNIEANPVVGMRIMTVGKVQLEIWRNMAPQPGLEPGTG